MGRYLAVDKYCVPEHAANLKKKRSETDITMATVSSDMIGVR